MFRSMQFAQDKWCQVTKTVHVYMYCAGRVDKCQLIVF